MEDQGNEAESLARRIWSYINGNKIKSLIVLLVLFFLLCLLMWFIDDDNNLANDVVSDQTAEILIPEQADGPIIRTDWKYDNFNFNVSLQYQIADGWTKTSDVDEDLNEFVYLRSPKDANGFYYCLDLLEYNKTATIDLDMVANVVDSDTTFVADGIGKPLNLIAYQPLGGGFGFHTTVIDDTSVTTGEDVAFNESITNPDGRMLQVLGQYNCDDPLINGFTLAEYQGGLLYMEGFEMMHSIAY